MRSIQLSHGKQESFLPSYSVPRFLHFCAFMGGFGFKMPCKERAEVLAAEGPVGSGDGKALACVGTGALLGGVQAYSPCFSTSLLIEFCSLHGLLQAFRIKPKLLSQAPKLLWSWLLTASPSPTSSIRCPHRPRPSHLQTLLVPLLGRFSTCSAASFPPLGLSSAVRGLTQEASLSRTDTHTSFTLSQHRCSSPSLAYPDKTVHSHYAQ